MHLVQLTAITHVVYHNLTNRYGSDLNDSLNQTSCSCMRIIHYTSSFSDNYALKSALLSHANTKSLDVTECNQLSW